MALLIRRTLSLVLLGLVLGHASSAAAAPARERPTFRQAHTAEHMVLDDYADLIDGRLVLGPCRRAGAFSTACRVRIVGPTPERYRVLVTGTPARDFLVTVRGRR